MPERWQRELGKLRDVEPREHAIRERAERGPSVDRPPSRRNPLIAGVVAGAVVIAGIVFLWQLTPSVGSRKAGGAAGDLPTLMITFESNGTIGETPSDAEPIRRVDTTISYGDALEEDFTSITPDGAHVDYVSVDQITQFVPGPTSGSPVRIETDGDDARVLVGDPADWPELERFTPIEQLPAEPGDYVLLFETVCPDGLARTARAVRIVAPGTMQLAVTGMGWEASASAFVDGARTDGLLSGLWGEPGEETDSGIPPFGSEAVTRLDPGSTVVLSTEMLLARGGLFGEKDAADLDILPRNYIDAVLPWDLTTSDTTLPSQEGRYLFALEVGWNPGDGSPGGSPAALFIFPIEIVNAVQQSEPPETDSSPIPSPTPSSLPSDVPVAEGIVVSVFGVGERSNDAPIATFSYAGETKPACTQDFEWTMEDGTKFGMTLDPGGVAGAPGCAGRAIEVPPGTPIAIEATTTTRVSTTRATTQFFEGDVGLVVSAEWPEGEATFIVPLTVAFTDPDLELVVLDCRPEDQVTITPPENRNDPGGSAYIVGNLPGFERDDVVEQMTREQGSGAGDLAGVWQVVRDGTVVASVDYPELSGTACQGSGIGEP